MVQAASYTAADGSSLKEFHQRVPLLQLIFILVPLSLILKKMTLGECAQPPLPYLAHPYSFLCPSLRGPQTQRIFIFLKGFIVSFTTYSRDQVSSPEFSHYNSFQLLGKATSDGGQW